MSDENKLIYNLTGKLERDGDKVRVVVSIARGNEQAHEHVVYEFDSEEEARERRGAILEYEQHRLAKASKIAVDSIMEMINRRKQDV